MNENGAIAKKNIVPLAEPDSFGATFDKDYLSNETNEVFLNQVFEIKEDDRNANADQNKGKSKIKYKVSTVFPCLI